MSNKTYDVLKNLAQIWIPALSALYFALAQIWNLPYAEQIVGTLAAVDTFLGAILGISSKNYNSCNDDLEYVDMEADDGK